MIREVVGRNQGSRSEIESLCGHFSGYWKRPPIVAIATARTQPRPDGLEIVAEPAGASLPGLLREAGFTSLLAAARGVDDRRFLNKLWQDFL